MKQKYFLILILFLFNQIAHNQIITKFVKSEEITNRPYYKFISKAPVIKVPGVDNAKYIEEDKIREESGDRLPIRF